MLSQGHSIFRNQIVKTMSIYDNETSKIGSHLNPVTVSQQVNLQNYKLAKISEVETYFPDEIAKIEKLTQTMQRLATISNVYDTILITTAVVTGSSSISAFGNGLALLIDVPISSMYVLLVLANAASRKSTQLFTGKHENCNLIWLLPPEKIRQHW